MEAFGKAMQSYAVAALISFFVAGLIVLIRILIQAMGKRKGKA